MNIKAVIFDMDGLLINSEPFWDKTDRELFQKRGYTVPSEVLVKRLGTGHKRTMEIIKEASGVTEDTDTLIKERLVIFYGLLEKNLVLMAGAKDLIYKLTKEGKKLTIATGGHSQEKVATLLRKMEIAQYFSVIVSGDDVARHKPFPDIFLLAAKNLQVEPGASLVLEDAPSGVQAGKAAGMTVYGVNKDVAIKERLKEAGADKVFTSLAEVDL